MLYSTLSIPTIVSSPMNRISSPVTPPSRSTSSGLNASRYYSTIPRSWPPSPYPTTLDYSLQAYLMTRTIVASKPMSPISLDYTLQVNLNYDLLVHIQTRTITASKYISNLAQSGPPGAFPNSQTYSLQVHCQTRFITASKCISKLAQLLPPNAHLQSSSFTASNCISKLAPLPPPSASLSSHNHCLPVHLQTGTGAASKCIPKSARSQPPSVLPYLLDYGLRTRLITASVCISKFTWSRGGETVVQYSRHPIMNTPLHLARYPNGIHQKEWF